MRKREDQDYLKEYQRGESTRFLVGPNYPMPAIPTKNVFIGEYLTFINEQGNPQMYTPFS